MKKLLLTALITIVSTVAVQAQTLTSAQVQADVTKVLQEKSYIETENEIEINNLGYINLPLIKQKQRTRRLYKTLKRNQPLFLYYLGMLRYILSRSGYDTCWAID